MALQIVLDQTAENGNTYPTAYWRIDGFQWLRADRIVNVQIGVYRDTSTATAKQPVAVRVFTALNATATAIVTAADIQAAIYTWLKTLPAFTGAADV